MQAFRTRSHSHRRNLYCRHLYRSVSPRSLNRNSSSGAAFSTSLITIMRRPNPLTVSFMSHSSPLSASGPDHHSHRSLWSASCRLTPTKVAALSPLSLSTQEVRRYISRSLPLPLTFLNHWPVLYHHQYLVSLSTTNCLRQNFSSNISCPFP